MIDEAFEFLISQYADGSLPESQRPAVEARLADDAEAQAMLAQYRRLDAALAAAPKLPAVRWDRLAASISAAVDAADEEQAREQSKVYNLTWYRRTGVWAAAASVLIAAGVAIKLASPGGGGHPAPSNPVQVTPQPAAPAPQAVVEGPQPEKATGPAVSNVAITQPTGGPNGAGGYAPYAQGVVAQPSHVSIVASTNAARNDKGDKKPVPAP